MEKPVPQLGIKNWFHEIWTDSDENACEKAMRDLTLIPTTVETDYQSDINDMVIKENVIDPRHSIIEQEPIIEFRMSISEEELQWENLVKKGEKLLKRHEKALMDSKVNSLKESNFRFCYENEILTPRIDQTLLANENDTKSTYISLHAPRKTKCYRIGEFETQKTVKNEVQSEMITQEIINTIAKRDCDFCRKGNHPLQKCTKYIPIKREFPYAQIQKSKGRKYCFLCKELDTHYAPTCEQFEWISRRSANACPPFWTHKKGM